MEEKQNAALGTAPLGKLMVKFALPCTISLLVGALYNIVDQIFIGWGVGYLGNGATNIVFPITIIALALAVLIGGPFALGFWLGGVRAKYRIKNEKLKMKN